MFAVPEALTDSRVAVQGVALSLLVFGLGCDESAEPPSAEVLSPRTETAPRCSRDDECVVVDVALGEVVALHRDQPAPSFDQTVEGARAPWAPPEEFVAYCADGECALDEIRWAEFRRCEAVGARCVLVEDPCGESVAVLATRVEEAQSAIASPARREMCAGRSARARPSETSAGATAPRCLRGFCR